MLKIVLPNTVIIGQLRRELKAAYPELSMQVQKENFGNGVERVVRVLSEVSLQEANGIQGVIDAHVPEEPDDDAFDKKERGEILDQSLKHSPLFKALKRRVKDLEDSQP